MTAVNSLVSTAVLLVLPLTIVSYALYNFLFHPLASIPGPIWVRTGLWSWKSMRAVKLDMGWKLLELHEKYGKVVRIARNEVSICDPSAIGQIYRFKSPLEKARFYESLHGRDGPNALSTLENKRHAEMRRAESPAYAATLLIDFEQNVNDCGDELIAHLDRCLSVGKATVNLSEALQMFAIDVIGAIVLGKSFEICANGKDTHNFLSIPIKFLELACLLGTQPTISRLLRWLSGKLPEPPSIRILTGIVNGRIASRFQHYKEGGPSSHRDMLEKLMAAQNADGSEYNLEQVQSAAGLFLGAGSDTTAITMRAMIRFVVGDPRIYAKVQEEIDSAVQSGTITFPLSYSDACNLEYFQACLRETLRLHPPVPWTLSRSVGAGGTTICGHFFSEGTEVSMSPFVLHRRPEAYGDDAALFRPERWIEADADHRKVMEQTNLAFGSGPRVCIGKTIGMMEVSKVMPLLFWKYSIEFTPRSATSPHKRSQWVALQSDFWCDLTHRRAC
ncbi:cytochrome P450 oxidoreductase [Mycena galericulata]|nr:cytochrome P450 oxidoreductase [Mycena galericulata]